jgi:origin recognition complex subunit 1
VELRELEPDKEEDEEVEEEVESEAEVEVEDDVEEEITTTTTPRKRKTKTTTTTPKKKRPAAKTRMIPTPKKGRKVPHPKSSTSNLPITIAPEDLPTDPYQRALRLLHVGATPESLPCREEEFVDVLTRVEEGVEGGGGGCLCESHSMTRTGLMGRYRRCTWDRKDSNSPRCCKGIKTKSRRRCMSTFSYV